ncbi:MAG: signal peptidase II [Deltaproteobacteria bacterium]|nr:signal peptidase II [Deltaproteobacteria bacterium]
MSLRMRWAVVVAVATMMVVLDQWSKFLAVRNLTPGIANAHERAVAEGRARGAAGVVDDIRYFYGDVENPCAHDGFVYPRCEAVSVIDGFWAFRYVENKGAAWGLFAGTHDKFRVPFFFAISIAAIAFIFSYLRKIGPEQRMMLLALSLVLGGALGNFIDRLHLRYVIDFIDWYVGTSHWPTFNVADAAISTGVALLVLDGLLEPSRKKKAEADRRPEPSEVS